MTIVTSNFLTLYSTIFLQSLIDHANHYIQEEVPYGAMYDPFQEIHLMHPL